MSSNRRTALILGGIVLVAALVTWWSVMNREADAPAELPPAANSLADDQVAMYTDLAGNRFSLEQYLGNVLVVTSWASWCPFCDKELTTLSEIARLHEGDGVVALAINRAERQATVEQYLKTIDAPGVVFALDPADRYHTSIGGYTTPETIIYDQSGQIVLHKRGQVSLSELRFHIQQLTTTTP